MHPENEALQAQLNAANTILRRIWDQLHDPLIGNVSTMQLLSWLAPYLQQPLPVWAALFTSELEATNG